MKVLASLHWHLHMENESEKSRIALWGETSREVGVLVMVFGPMYLKFETQEVGLTLLSDCALWIVGGIIMSAFAIELQRRF